MLVAFEATYDENNGPLLVLTGTSINEHEFEDATHVGIIMSRAVVTFLFL